MVRVLSSLETNFSFLEMDGVAWRDEHSDQADCLVGETARERERERSEKERLLRLRWGLLSRPLFIFPTSFSDKKISSFNFFSVFFVFKEFASFPENNCVQGGSDYFGRSRYISHIVYSTSWRMNQSYSTSSFHGMEKTREKKKHPHSQRILTSSMRHFEITPSDLTYRASSGIEDDFQMRKTSTLPLSGTASSSRLLSEVVLIIFFCCFPVWTPLRGHCRKTFRKKLVRTEALRTSLVHSGRIEFWIVISTSKLYWTIRWVSNESFLI